MELISVFKHALTISFFVFVMMMLVDFIDAASRKRFTGIMEGGLLRQYTLASFLGSTPGCLGAFMNVSLYVHGMISFGAVVGGMIATSGDEAFVMLTQFPGTALILFVLLFISGIFFAGISDKLIQFLKITPCESCLEAECEHCEADSDNREGIRDIFRPANIYVNFKSLSFTRFLILLFIVSFIALTVLGEIGPVFWGWKRITFLGLSICSLYITSVTSEHYLHYHIWDHIIRKHLFRIFLWSFGALFFVHWGMSSFNLEAFVQQHMIWVLIISAVMGIVPESGPHLVFVMMYAQGIVPFSVLFTSSFVQDGHGMLPMLSYSLKDTMLIKVFNFFFGTAIGGVLLAFGL